jgi:uncharacterized protein (TIGR02145 family)
MKISVIGKQIWMRENLNVSHYRNGDPIPQVIGREEWSNLRTGAWCYYDHHPENGKKYGKLYNWYAVNDPRGLAPRGWHIPTQAVFEKLKAEITNNGNVLKAERQGSGIGAGTNTSYFSAMLAGYRIYEGRFSGLGYAAVFWSSTDVGNNDACILNMYSNSSGIYIYGNSKELGFSVRCIKD